MSKETGVIILGLLVAIVPYLGVYTSWKTPLLVGLGLATLLLGFLLRGEAISRDTGKSENHPFIEHAPEVRE